MGRLIVFAVIVATGCSSGGSEAPADPPATANEPPPKQNTPAPEKPGSFTHRLLLQKDIAIPDLRKRVASAATAMNLTHEKGGPKSKCRRVQYLDAGGALRKQGMSLRVRRKLDRECLLDSNRLAMSFNLRSGDLLRANRARTQLSPAQNLDAKRTKLRYRLDTSIGARVYTPRYIAGGTIRGLNEQPETLDDLRAMFPKLDVEGSAELVAVTTLIERNYDFGRISNGSIAMPIEVAVWSADDGHVATELSYEYDSAEGAGAMATSFARALKTELDGSIHTARWREDVAYGATP